MHSTTSPAPRPFTMHNAEFVALLASMQAMQALAIDAMLPALGAMSADLGVHDANKRQLVVGIFLLFTGLGSLIPGATADRYGRKPVLLVCLVGYVAMMLLSSIAGSFDLLLIARALAGLFASGMAVLPLAIIRDRFEGDKMARLQSMIAVIFMVVPMIAPSLGQFVLLLAGWRWIFGIMATMGTLVAIWTALRLPETLHPEFRQPIRLSVIRQNLQLSLTTRMAIGYIVGAALVQGALFGFINSVQQLIGEHFGAGTWFPLVFGGMALCMAFANFGNSRIVERFGARRVSHTALLAYIVLAALQLWFATRPEETIRTFVPLMTLNMCMMGFIGANFAAIALQPFARIAGSAASVQVFIRMLAAAAIGIVIGQSYDNTARPLATGLLVAGIGSLALVLFSEHGRLFRRLHGQVTPAAVAEG